MWISIVVSCAEGSSRLRSIHGISRYQVGSGARAYYGAVPLDSWSGSLDQILTELEVLGSDGGVLVTYGHHIKLADQPELLGVFIDELEMYINYCIYNGMGAQVIIERVQEAEFVEVASGKGRANAIRTVKTFCRLVDVRAWLW